MKILFFWLILMNGSLLWADEVKKVSFETADGGTVFALFYPAQNVSRGVVLAHGAMYDKLSWHRLADRLQDEGICVLAIDFRGYGKSVPGSKSSARYEDILAAVRYLHREANINHVAVLGASMGGGAAARAAIEAKDGEIDKLVLLSPVPVTQPELIKGHVLYIASAEEAMIGQIKEQFDRVQSEKQLQLLDGSAHAQHIFDTDQEEKLTSLIVDFLKD
ncbi:MAG: alpha/beta hydrolase [Gammaproteobacteria bacterium]